MINFRIRGRLIHLEVPPNTACTRPSEEHRDHGGGSLRVFRQLRSLRLIPLKWRCLVPGERRDGAQSRPPAVNANRWALHPKCTEW